MLSKISGSKPVKSSGSAKKTSSTSPSGAFSKLLGIASTEENQQISQLSDISATAAIGNMLALQEISEEDVRRQKLVQQGKNMLEALEELRRRLLLGNIPNSTLQALSRQLSIQRQQVADPKLMSLIDDIELRVAVELAKLERAANPGV